MILSKCLMLVLVTAMSQVYCENDTEILHPIEELERVEPKQSNRFKFEDDSIIDDERQGYGLIKFDDQNPERPQVFQDSHSDNGLYNNGAGVKFQDDNSLDVNTSGQKKKRRRRRRRRPRQGYGLAPGAAGAYAQHRPNPAFGTQPLYLGPPRRRPSMAESALATVAGALGSIARHDDLQCVPRLLCEAAGGSAAPGGSAQGSAQGSAVAALQPLITLLAAYGGVSGSPLLVFGRAALLGLASRGGADPCRGAYPRCPAQPDQLVEYLNNHNGGFFRFFNSPPPSQGQQNLEQFYNHLSNIQPQNGLSGATGNYDPSNGNLAPYQYSQNYGVINQNVNGYPQSYGLLMNQNFNMYPQYQIYPPPGLYPVPGQQGYGFGYPYGQANVNYKNVNSQIEKRIQNSPASAYKYIDTENASSQKVKWHFPSNNVNVHEGNVRTGKGFVFPEDTSTKIKYVTSQNFLSDKGNKREAKGFNFPEKQSNRSPVEFEESSDVHSSYILAEQENVYEPNTYEDYEFGSNTESQDANIEVVYVLRGDTDPYNPEVFRLRPGKPHFR